MMDFNLIQDELIKTFKVSKDDVLNDVLFFGRNIKSKWLEYSLKVDVLTPELITRWSENFGSGSYFGVSKEFNQEKLTLIISISDRDYSWFFNVKHPEIKLNKLGIVQNEKEALS